MLSCHLCQLEGGRFRRDAHPMAIMCGVARKVNKKEWQELHTRLNGGVPVLPDAQLPYFFDEAASWCAPADQILLN